MAPSMFSTLWKPGTVSCKSVQIAKWAMHIKAKLVALGRYVGSIQICPLLCLQTITNDLHASGHRGSHTGIGGMVEQQRAAGLYLAHELPERFYQRVLGAIDIEVVGVGAGHDGHVGVQRQEAAVVLVGLHYNGRGTGARAAT